MKIVVKSTYAQNDGWGKATRDYLKAFTLTAHDITVQPIVLGSVLLKQLPDWIPPQTKNEVPDLFFQQCLPQYFERFSNIKRHIGSCFTETRHLEQTGWVDRLNDMDEIIVATQQEELNLIESGVSKKIHVVPMPMDFSQLSESGKLSNLEAHLSNRFAFYFIGELVDRKNIVDLLFAYWREFSLEDNVALVIKTSIGNINATDMTTYASQFLESVKATARMYDYHHHYPEVIFLVDRLSEEDMVKLHNTCNCFITLSHGESTCRPLIDAAYKGKQIICTDGIGAIDPALTIAKVKSVETPCLVNRPPLPFLYTGWETWMKPDVLHAQHLMRQAYENKLAVSSIHNIKEKFSYESVAKRLNDIL